MVKKPEKSDEPTIGGYKPEDVLLAPLEAPKPADTRPPNLHQRRVIGLGTVIILLGVFLWPLFNLSVAVGVAIAGALTIAYGSLVRV